MGQLKVKEFQIMVYSVKVTYILKRKPKLGKVHIDVADENKKTNETQM